MKQNKTDINQGINKISLIGISLWLIAAIFYGLDYLQHTAPSVLILPISKSIGVNFVSIANVMNIYFPIYAISQIPAGYLIDRFGLRKTLSLSSILVSIGLLMMSIPSIYAILFGRILIAIGSATAFIGGLKAASIWLPESTFPLMVGLLQSIGVIGGLVGQVFLNHLINKIHWQATIYDLSLFGIFWAAIIFIFLKKNKKIISQKTEKNHIKKSDILAILKDKKLWILAFYAALTVGAVMSTFAETYSVIILEKLKHFSSQHAAFLSSMIIAGVGVGAPLHGIISAKFKNRSTWLIISSSLTLLIYALIITYINSNQTTDLIAILYFLLGFFVSVMLLVFSIAKENYPTNKHGMIFAFLQMMIGLGGFFVPLAFGKIIDLSHKISSLPNNLIIPIFALILPIIIYILLAIKIGSFNNNKKKN